MTDGDGSPGRGTEPGGWPVRPPGQRPAGQRPAHQRLSRQPPDRTPPADSPLAGAQPPGSQPPAGPQPPARQPPDRVPPGHQRRSPALPARQQALQQQLARQITTGRRARRQRAWLAILGAASALVLLTSGSAWALTSYLTGHLHRLSAGTSGTPGSGPLNILVAGVDIRTGLTSHQEARLHVGHDISTNSDTLMLVHIPANHAYIQVVSLPRDSWVAIPGHGMNKINAAFGLGGPRLMVATVEAATGLDINDYVEVNFLGFVKIIDAVGGVNICLPFAVDDAYSGLRLSAGTHHVDGVTALEFARDRHSFAASDLTRIDDQQQLLSTMLSRSVSAGTLSNPFKLRRLLSAVTSAIQVDQGFNLVELVNELRGIRPSDVAFTTVPLGNLSYQAPDGQSAVLWDATQAQQLFTQIRNDQRPAAIRSRGHGTAKGRHGRRRAGHAASARTPPAAAAAPDPGQARTAAQDACR